MPFGERRDDAKDSQWGGDGGDDDGGGGRDDDNGDNDDEGGGRTPTPPPTLSIVSRVRMPRGIDVRDRSFFVFVKYFSSARKSHRLPATLRSPTDPLLRM